MLKNSLKYLLELFYPLFRKAISFEVFAYITVGGINTGLNILLFILMYQFVFPFHGFWIGGVHIESYSVSLAVAFLLTVPTGFWFAKHFAFNSGNNESGTLKQLFRYFLVVLQGLGSDYLILVALIEIAGMNPPAAKILSTGLVLTINFLLQKYFTFRVKTA